MSTQYDAIGTSYDEMRKLPVALLECSNVQAAVHPYIKGARVLDLACGTGHYSKLFLAWGALEVVGVDISSTMISAARQSVEHDQHVTFHTADCSVPAQYEGGPFDLVFGSWLLNYAPDRQQMLRMFQNIALNLNDGGHFVGVTPHPTEDPRLQTEKALSVRPARYEEITVGIKQEIPDGVETHLVANTRAGKVEFDAYYLRKSIHEQSAVDGGLRGNLSWIPVTIPSELKNGQANQGLEDWEIYMTVPHFGILVVAK
ncbi:MAG: hypothetical protein Q9184_006036 [Pyrenodesmia sp. 2 TL-2023]